MEIKGKDVDEVVYKASKALLNAPEESPRGLKTKELVVPKLIIEDPRLCVMTNPGRKLSKRYLAAEMDWYNSGQKSIEGIKEYSSMWEKIADKNGEVNSNYGEIVHHQELPNFDGSQYDWVIKQLMNDRESRQAIINYNQPKHKSETNDFVCTIGTNYLIRDNKLVGITYMRSNDLIYGFSYDFPFFSNLQQDIHKQLTIVYPDLELGENIHIPSSLHVYERHFGMLEKIVTEYEKGDIKSGKL